MNLNDENIDDLMFQLLEGEIQGEERNRLLDAIHEDKYYSQQWKAWQQTILNPNDELLVMNTDKLLKRKNNMVILWWKYAAAAMIICTFSLVIYVASKKSDKVMVHQENTPPSRNQIIKVPAIAPVTTILPTSDSVITYKQKVRMMAEHPKNNSKSNVPVQEQELIEQPPLQIVYAPKDINQQDAPKMNLDERQNEYNKAVNEYSDGVFMSVYSEKETEQSSHKMVSKLEEKRNLISRFFSKPEIKIESDSNTYSKRKFIIENKAYKIIAGF